MRGVWKADLFLGNHAVDNWVGTSVKIKRAALEGAPGLRIGIYPKTHARDDPRRDEILNLILLPLPYDGEFMELFYKSFYLVRAFLDADARLPAEVRLPDAEDRYICRELESRRMFPISAVVEVLREMSQRDLLKDEGVAEVRPTAALSIEAGLESDPPPLPDSEFVSLSPVAEERTGEA